MFSGEEKNFEGIRGRTQEGQNPALPKSQLPFLPLGPASPTLKHGPRSLSSGEPGWRVVWICCEDRAVGQREVEGRRGQDGGGGVEGDVGVGVGCFLSDSSPTLELLPLCGWLYNSRPHSQDQQAQKYIHSSTPGFLPSPPKIPFPPLVIPLIILSNSLQSFEWITSPDAYMGGALVLIALSLIFSLQNWATYLSDKNHHKF